MRRALVVVIVLAAMLGGGLWAAPRLLPEGTVERWLVARVEAAFGVDLQIVGASRFELLPRPALTLGAWRSTTPVGPLEAAGARIRFDPTRLLRGEAAIAAARIERARLVVVAPPATVRPAALLAALDPGIESVELADGRIVVPHGEDLRIARGVVRGDGDRRRVTAAGSWRGRALEFDAVIAPGARPALHELELRAGEDRLSFRGQLGPQDGGGELAFDLVDPAAFAAWLPAWGRPPTAGDAARALAAPLTVQGRLAREGADWRLDEAEIAGAGVRLEGTIALADGRIDARLELREGPPPAELLAATLAPLRSGAVDLEGLARLALDGEDLRLRLDRDADGFAASLRVRLAGASELTAEGRVTAGGPRFEGPITLVSDDIAAALPAALAAALPRPAPFTLSAAASATPARMALRELRLSAPGLVLRGAIDLDPTRRPALAVEGVLDRLRLPTDALATPVGRGRALARLREWAERGGARLDLEVRRLVVDEVGGLEGRVVAGLDRQGLWVTAFEAAGPEVRLSLTGGLELDPPRLDALGALRVAAPGRLTRRLVGEPWPALATVPGGLFDVALRGPLDALGVELDGRLGALAARFEGTTRLLATSAASRDAEADVEGHLTLAHADAGALLEAWGAPPHPSRPLAGPARFAGTVTRSDGWAARGEVALAGLRAALDLRARRLQLRDVVGPADDLHAGLTALTPWPADLARWRARVQGDWPQTPVLAERWPAPFALELTAPGLITADGRAANFDLALAGDARRLELERLRWRTAEARYTLEGAATRGVRGVAVELAGTVEDVAGAAVPTALGLGWLGSGPIRLEGALDARGTTPGELAASLAGRLAVEAAFGPGRRRGDDGRLLTLPALELAGVLAVDRGRFALSALDAAPRALDGTVDVFADRVVARLRPGDTDAGAILLAHGPLDRPRWRHLDAHKNGPPAGR